jgi:hypothetical protein
MQGLPLRTPGFDSIIDLGSTRRDYRGASLQAIRVCPRCLY